MKAENNNISIKLTKKVLILLLIFTSLLSLNGCKKVKTIDNPIALGYIGNEAFIINNKDESLSLNKYDEVLPIFDTYLMVKKDNKWGFIKNNGDKATKIEYSRICPMKEEKAVVVLKNKTVIINPSGDVLYTFPDSITSYSYFNENKLIIEKDGQLGYLEYIPSNKKFHILVEPTFDSADIFYEGLAVVGKKFEIEPISEDDPIQTELLYTYIKEDGTLLHDEYIFDEADRFSCGYAKVSLASSSNQEYQFLKPQLNEENKLEYLTKKGSSAVLVYDYATRFENNITFVADYHRYNLDNENLTEDNQYYKSFTFFDTNGEVQYKAALNNYALEKPKNFLPVNPFYIDDVFIFVQGDRNASKWNILRYSISQLPDENDNYYEVYTFTKAKWDLPEDNKIIKNYMEQNDCTYKLAVSYLNSPYAIGNITYKNTTKSYVAMCKIAGNKCGIIEISTKKIETPVVDVLDEYDVTVKYIVSTIYDNIVC